MEVLKYINQQKDKLNITIIYTNKFDGLCNAVTIYYKNQYIIYLNEKLNGKEKILTILHEISHIQLGYLGEKYAKKKSSSIYEKIVDINMILKIRGYISNFPKMFFLSFISEKKLYQTIKFKGV